jgi:hypothetical protein
MPRGGPQPNSGRKPGTKNRTTVERELRARFGLQAVLEDGGPLPLDILTSRMRDVPLPTGQRISDEMFQAAVAAAPYIHPRLAQADLAVRSDNVVRIISEAPMSVEQWCREHNVSTAGNDDAATPVIEGTASAAD